ncbi:MAG: hypothetical protein AB7S38_31550 [Vulcanimicrobiota bacterium]
MRKRLALLGLLLLLGASSRPVAYEDLTIAGLRPGHKRAKAEQTTRGWGKPTRSAGPLRAWGDKPNDKGYTASGDTYKVWSVWGPELDKKGKPFLKAGASEAKVKKALGEPSKTVDETDYRVLEFWFYDDGQVLKVTFVDGRGAVKYALTDHGLLGPGRVPPKD